MRLKVQYTPDGERIYRDHPLGYAHAGDAGIDLRTTTAEDIAPGETRIVGTGVRMEIPEGYVGLCFPRSGLASKKGVTLANCVGVIDSGYRGEVMAPLRNQSGEHAFIDRGERVFQLIVMPFPSIEVVEGPVSDTERGDGGFGSTGTL